MMGRQKAIASWTTSANDSIREVLYIGIRRCDLSLVLGVQPWMNIVIIIKTLKKIEPYLRHHARIPRIRTIAPNGAY
jgi:hypothetical protein